MYTPRFFDIFVSSSGSLHLRLAKLPKFSKLQLSKIQFYKIKMFDIKSRQNKHNNINKKKLQRVFKKVSAHLMNAL